MFVTGPGWGPRRPLFRKTSPQSGKPNKSELFSRFAVVSAVLAAMLAPAPAWSASCTNIANLNLSQFSDLSAGGSPAQVAVPPVELEAGDIIDFSTSVIGGSGTVTVTVLDSPGDVQNGVDVGPFAAGSSGQFTATASGLYEFRYTVDGGTGTLSVGISASCNPGTSGSGGGSGSSTSPEEKQKITDALVRTADVGRLSNAPADLPDREDFTPDFIALQEKVDEAKRRLDELRRTRDQVSRAQIEASSSLSEVLRNRYGGNLETAMKDPKFAASFELSRDLLATGEDLDEQIDIQEAKVVKLEEAADLDIFGEDVLQYAPGSRNPAPAVRGMQFWPFIGGTDTIRTGARANGHMFDLWTRMQLSAIDGSLDRDGTTFNGQLGLVRSLSNNLDGGLFVSVFSSDINTGDLASNLDSLGFGAGGYLKFSINDRLRAGISTSFERSDNDINIGGATGSFHRNRFTLDASLSSKRVVRGVTVIPSANLSWVHSDRDSYVDSVGTAVPSTTDDTLTATTALSLSRAFVPDNPAILAVTPNLNLAVNFHLIRFDDVVFTDGSQIGYGAVTGTVSGGVDVHFVNGNSLNIAATAGGIGGDTQAYGIGAQFRMPLP